LSTINENISAEELGATNTKKTTRVLEAAKEGKPV